MTDELSEFHFQAHSVIFHQNRLDVYETKLLFLTCFFQASFWSLDLFIWFLFHAGTSIDQGIAYVLMLVALVLTYLIHPLDASSPYRLF
uniref:Uncharacterized protein n=1 Tax=Aegilops tauschii subsp. strangulata TaxID=200361 RepID=A0A453S7B3_AEGTS